MVIALTALGLTPLLVSWGICGHEKINHMAVLMLPSPMQTFFYNHIDFITQESTVPDLRKYTLNDRSESPRHYIDLENYGGLDSLPHTMEAAKKKYDEKFLSQNGILPWYMESMMEKLTKAFKEKKKTEILFIAADLGHYLADAHMPLHTTDNHDGQKTDQKGIHAFWEAQLPELYVNTYTFKTTGASYIDNVHKEIWNILRNSHELADTLLMAEQTLKRSYPASKIYETDASDAIIKNKFNQPVHSKAYAAKYHEALKGMVEKQMVKATNATANFWYTAWVNAGKPDLDGLDAPELSRQNEKLLKAELDQLKAGRHIPLVSENEF